VELVVTGNKASGPPHKVAERTTAARVVPTNEELMIARHTQRLLGA
jgi:acetate kinase